MRDIVANRKIRNLENIEGIDKNAQIKVNRVLFLKMKDKMQKDEILMPKSKAPSKKEKTLSLPNHNGFNNHLPYPLQLTHPPFMLLTTIPFTNYSYILTILLIITIITPFLYISNNQVPNKFQFLR
jgi:hypothetical protein